MKTFRILFLGYKENDTKLISFFRKKKIIVTENGQKILNIKNLAIYDLILSYGYKSIIKKKILKQLKRPPINLHISYLPYNRGSDPNYWSFKEKTPSGITIHEIDDGVDTGNIIYRKKIEFKNKKKETLKSTYWTLRKEIEKLFVRKYKEILNNTYKSFKIKNKGTYHKKSDLKKNKRDWNIKISEI